MRPRQPTHRSRTFTAEDYLVLTSVGATYRRARIDADMSRVEVAEIIEMHLSSVANFERGAQNVALTVLARMATAIGEQPSTLLAKAGL